MRKNLFIISILMLFCSSIWIENSVYRLVVSIFALTLPVTEIIGILKKKNNRTVTDKIYLVFHILFIVTLILSMVVYCL